MPLQSLDPIYVNFARAAAAGAAELRVGRDGAASPTATRRPRVRRAASPRSTRSSTRRPATSQVQATLANPNGKLRPGMFVAGAASAWARRRRVVALPASAISYAPYGDSVFVVEDAEGPERQDVPRRAPAVREARAARAATRSPCCPAQAGRGGRDLGRLQAAQRRRGPGQQRGAARRTTRRPSRRTADAASPISSSSGRSSRSSSTW